MTNKIKIKKRKKGATPDSGGIHCNVPQDIVADLPESITGEEPFLYPPGVTPKPFQLELVNQTIRLMKHEQAKGVYNGSDMGLGKTFMTITTLNLFNHYLKRSSGLKTLIVVPASLRANWDIELRKFSTQTPVTCRVIYGQRDAMQDINSNFCVVSYNMLLNKTVLNKILSKKWDFLVCDEMQNCKSIKAKRTEKVVHLYRKIPKAIFLSGTPMPNSTLDLFPALKLLIPEHIGTPTDFAETYCKKRKVKWGWGFQYYGGKNLDQLSAIMRKKCFIRKSKSCIADQLPNKTFQKIEVTCNEVNVAMSNADAEMILASLESAVAKDDEDSFKKTMNKPQFALLRQELALNKIDGEGGQFIQGLLESGEPLTIFAFHHIVLDRLQEKFSSYNPVRLDGKVSAKEKDKVRQYFNSGQTNLLLGQIQTAGIGHNLQDRCSTCVFVETSFSPGEINQAVDRFHRIGQKDNVIAYFITAKNSIDSRVGKILVDKARIIDEVIQDT